MNKDMMNIDDFVREKLGGHSEKEDSVAWLKMKALLDKEMPEKPAPFYFRLGKPMAFLGAALLIGALCVGGYKLNAIREKSLPLTAKPSFPQQTTANNSSSDNKIQANKDNNTAINSTTSATTPIAGKTTTDQQQGNLATNAAGNTTSVNNTTENTNNPKKETSATADKNVINNTQKHSATASLNSKATGREIDETRVIENVKNRKAAKSKSSLKATLANNKKAATRTSENAGNLAKAGRNKDQNDAPINSENRNNKKPVAKAEIVLASGAATAKSVKDLSDDKKSSTNKKTNESSLIKDNKVGTGRVDPNDNNTTEKATAIIKDEPKDSMSAITVVTKQSTSKGYPKKTMSRMDTVAITKFAINEDKDIQVKKQINNKIVTNTIPGKKDIKLASAASKKANKLAAEQEQQKNILSAKMNSAEESGSNSNIAKAQKKEKSSLSKWVQNLNLPEAIASAKQDAHNAQFYAGFMAGVNYSLPNNNDHFQGVQFGPTGELVFNKHWSLFGAIKYFNRSGNKKSVSDNYSAQIADRDSIRGANWYYTVRTDSTNRYYNFSTVHSFEMPITLHYTIRKFYLMTGINLAYYLPVNIEKVEKEYNNMNIHSIMLNSTKPILNETKPVLSTNDFGSRFGVGYVIGVGYQLSPSWQTDLRVVSSFWDNANGVGAKQLSKDFYKLPSVQLSFGYQFNRVKSRATFGPNSAP